MNSRSSLPPALVLAASADEALPGMVTDWLASLRGVLVRVSTGDEMMAVALRSRPRVAVLDGRPGTAGILEACRRIKTDSYTGIVPTLVLVSTTGEVAEAFDAGADEVLMVPDEGAPSEIEARLRALVRRSDRDTGVHPSTRLPGAVEIETELARRIELGEMFAVCYADLDHFKEFNDRYGYNNGDRIIRLLARILHDVVKGECGEQGFVGHIGGDDFIFVIPLEGVESSCQEIINVFDLLAPLQYSEPDRRVGYFFGKDRRGRLHRVPLMTLSIGVVTNARRRFVKASQVSELATEMKSYAKSLEGSVFSIDRRSDDDDDDESSEREAGGKVGAGELREASTASQRVSDAAAGSDARGSAERSTEQRMEVDRTIEGRAGSGGNESRATVRVGRAVAQLGED